MSGSVLYLLNVSNPDRLSADSGWIFANVLLPALADQGMEISLGGPVALPDARVRSLLTTAPQTKYRARFGVNMDEAAALLRASRPEVVVANQIEIAPALRAVMMETGCPGTLAGYCHYLPFHLGAGGEIVRDTSLNDGQLGMPVMLQFFAGLLACDRVMVHSETSYDWITGAAAHLNIELGDRLRIVMPARDPRVVRTGTPVMPEGEPVAVYNHRLYAHYGTSRFVELARRLTTESTARVTVLDLFGTRRSSRTLLDPSPERYRCALSALEGVEVVSDGGDRAVYRAVLEGAHFAFAPFRPGCVWSMSVIDCQAMGVPVIAPRLGWLTEAVDEQLLFDHDDQAIELARRLATDPGFWAHHSARARRFTEVLTPAATAVRFAAALS